MPDLPHESLVGADQGEGRPGRYHAADESGLGDGDVGSPAMRDSPRSAASMGGLRPAGHAGSPAAAPWTS